MEILRTRHLTKIYGKGTNQVTAVDDVTLSVEQGEFVAIVGSSGSGKSTLLHMLGGVDRPTSGSVVIQDEDIYRMNDDRLAVFRRRQVGLIYQFYNLIPVLNVEENMALPCELDGKKPDIDYLRELAETLGLSKRLKHLPNELSGGQQQRTAIGRALITRPAILLADEPTGNLDSRASDEIVALLKMSNRKYKQTIVMITHNLEIAKQADRVLTIEDGRIVNGEGQPQSSNHEKPQRTIQVPGEFTDMSLTGNFSGSVGLEMETRNPDVENRQKTVKVPEWQPQKNNHNGR